MKPPRLFTLLAWGQGARLLDREGRLLMEMDRVSPQARPSVVGILCGLLPPRAPLQLILAGPGLVVRCVEAPHLSPRERAEAHRRLEKAAGRDGATEGAQALETDPLAQGGHVLWVASPVGGDLGEWLSLLMEAGARPRFVCPWQRAVLRAGEAGAPSALYLTLARGAAHLLWFRGRNLLFMRAFPLPPGSPGPCPAVSGELAIFLSFIQQNHRGAALPALTVVGLAPSEPLAAMAQGLGLTIARCIPDHDAWLVGGAEMERRSKGKLDLLPRAIRDARKRRLSRILIGAAAAVMIALGAGVKRFLLRQEKMLEKEAIRAESARDLRRMRAREMEEAVRLRFGLLRVRHLEQRQRRAHELLEPLAQRILRPEGGVRFQKVEILQMPGEAQRHRFTVEGAAPSGRTFSLGALAGYYAHVSGHPGVELDPLEDVTVEDGSDGEGEEAAFTRFRLGGTAP